MLFSANHLILFHCFWLPVNSESFSFLEFIFFWFWLPNLDFPGFKTFPQIGLQFSAAFSVCFLPLQQVACEQGIDSILDHLTEEKTAAVPYLYLAATLMDYRVVKFPRSEPLSRDQVRALKWLDAMHNFWTFFERLLNTFWALFGHFLNDFIKFCLNGEREMVNLFSNSLCISKRWICGLFVAYLLPSSETLPNFHFTFTETIAKFCLEIVGVSDFWLGLGVIKIFRFCCLWCAASYHYGSVVWFRPIFLEFRPNAGFGCSRANFTWNCYLVLHMQSATVSQAWFFFVSFSALRFCFFGFWTGESKLNVMCSLLLIQSRQLVLSHKKFDLFMNKAQIFWINFNVF